MTLPYFHYDALRERYDEHLHAISQSLDDDQRRWLEQLSSAEPDSQSETRIDHLQIVIAANQPVIGLPETLLISRPSDTQVFLYHPLLGLSSHPNRRQLKQQLIADLKGGARAQALLHYCADSQKQRVMESRVSDFEAVLLDGPMCNALMLSINNALTQNLGQWQALLQAQPTPDELLQSNTTTPKDIAAQAAERLDAYWQSQIAGTSDTPEKRLTRLIKTLLLSNLTQQAWDGEFDANEQQRISAWLAGQEYSATAANLQAHRIRLRGGNGPSNDLNTLLVLTSHDQTTQTCYSYSLSDGWRRYASSAQLFRAQEDPQRQRIISNMLLTPESAPVLDQLASALLHMQQDRLRTALNDAVPAARHDACLQALYLEPDLDPRLRRIDNLYARPPEEDARQILELLVRAAQRYANDPNLLDPALKTLETHYTRYLQLAPNLPSVTTAALQRRFASLLQNGPALNAIKLNRETPQGSASTLQQLTWERLSYPHQALPALVVTGSAALDEQIVHQLVDYTSNDLRQTLKAALLQHARLEHGLAGNLQPLLLHLERTLLAQDPGMPVNALKLIDTLIQNVNTNVWYLTLDEQQEPQANVLMLSSERAADGILLWTCDQGFCLFDSHAALDQAVREWLPLAAQPAQQLLHWSRSDAMPLQRMLALQDRQHRDLTLNAFDQLVDVQMPADSLPDLMQAPIAAAPLLRHLQRVGQLTHQLEIRKTLPDWFNHAAVDQQQRYLQALALNLLVSPSAEDYLFDIEDIPAYANAVVAEQLDEDFTPGRFRPSAVFITTTRWISAPPALGEIPSGQAAARISHRQSLVEYALNHFRDWDYPITRVELGDGHDAPAQLSADYLHRLVRRLDIGAHYQALLKEKLAPSDPDFPHRRLLFCQQQPAQLLELAWRLHLKGELSQVAVNSIHQVLSMPEAHLRMPLDGQHIDLSPLLLVADEGLEADCIPGCYLFRTDDAQPMVLYMPFDPTFALQEFANGDALLGQLRENVTLQQCLLQRMPAEMRKRYEHGGFVEPHLNFSNEDDFSIPLRPGPISLSTRAITGNALHYLFEENAQHLQDMASAQLTTDAEVRWNALINVLSLAWEQVSMFVPGKVGLAVAAWQTEMLALQIIDQLEQQNWQQALAGLTSALIQGVWVGIAVRRLPDFWEELRQSPHYALSLQRYEAPAQALETLQYDPVRGVYALAETGEHFVDLSGRLYRAQLDEGQWYLAANVADDPGLRLEQDTQGSWRIAIDQSIPAHFNLFGNLGRGFVRWLGTRGDAVILAAGMRQIHRRMAQRGHVITQAYHQGLHYLNTALDNIRQATPVAQAPIQTLAILSDFFGVAHVDEALLMRVRQSLEKLHRVMSSADYLPHNSERYIIGTSPGPGVAVAFTFPADPFKQIFLMDDFFHPYSTARLPLLPWYSTNDADRVYQAAVLLHEFTHIACSTRDIRYVEANKPFVELLAPSVERNRLQSFHDLALSHRTPFNRLFKVRDNLRGPSRDISNLDRKGRAMILRISASETLDQARQRFLDDASVRSQIMLKNADSLTLLIYRLGRSRRQQNPVPG